MANWRDEISDRIQSYAEQHGCTVQDELGYGYDGIVFSTDRKSAIKALRFERLFIRERDVYLRLKSHRVCEVLGFKVPQLIHSDDTTWIVEMTIVSPPFVLDFAGAYLDQAPDYPPEVIADWRVEKADQFGERWPEVLRLIAAFKRFGIFLADVKPGNIEFKD